MNSEPRPLIVLTDAEGNIQAAVLPQTSRDKGAPPRIGLIPSEGEAVHEVPLPTELQGKDLGSDVFDDYKVVVDQGRAALRNLAQDT